MVMEVSPSTIFSMGQFASRHKTALYTFEHQHGYFADGPEVFEESMDEYIGNSIDARSTTKLKASHHRFLKWIAYDRKSSQSLDERAMRTCPIVECKRPSFSSYEAMLQHVHKCKHLPKGTYRCQECNRDFRINRFRDHESHKPQRAQNSLKRVSSSLKSEFRSARSLFSSHGSAITNDTIPDQSPWKASDECIALNTPELPCEQNYFPQELNSELGPLEMDGGQHCGFVAYGNSGAAAPNMPWNEPSPYHWTPTVMVDESIPRCCVGSMSHSGNSYVNQTASGDLDHAMFLQQNTTFEPYSSTTLLSHNNTVCDSRSIIHPRNLRETQQLSGQDQQDIMHQRNVYQDAVLDAPSPISIPVNNFHDTLPDHIVSPMGSYSSADELTRSSTLTMSSLPSTNTSMTDNLQNNAAMCDAKPFTAVLEDTELEFGEPDTMGQSFENVPVPARRPQPRRPRLIESVLDQPIEPDTIALDVMEDSAASGNADSDYVTMSLDVHIDMNNDLRAGMDDVLTSNGLEPLPQVMWNEDKLAEMCEPYALYGEGQTNPAVQAWQNDIETSTLNDGLVDVNVSYSHSPTQSDLSSTPTEGDHYQPSVEDHTTSTLYQATHTNASAQGNYSLPVATEMQSHHYIQTPPAVAFLPSPPPPFPQSPATTVLPSAQMTVQSPSSDSVDRCQYCLLVLTGLEKNKKSNLKRHQKHNCKTSPTYVGEPKSFRCPYANCTKGYGRRDALLVHQRAEKHDELTGVGSPVGHNDTGSSHDHMLDEGIYEGSGYGYYEWQDIDPELSRA